MGNLIIIALAEQKLENGYSENRVCDFVYQQCQNDNRANILLAKIFKVDEVKIGFN